MGVVSMLGDVSRVKVRQSPSFPVPSRVFVPGVARPQGSKRHVGNGVMVESSKGLAAYRKALVEGFAEKLVPVPASDVDVFVTVVFFYPRPKDHVSQSKAGGLKPSAPMFRAKRPDVDKLCRAVLDALQTSGVVFDDGQVVGLSAYKMYADSDERVGTSVWLHFDDDLPARLLWPA